MYLTFNNKIFTQIPTYLNISANPTSTTHNNLSSFHLPGSKIYAIPCADDEDAYSCNVSLNAELLLSSMVLAVLHLELPLDVVDMVAIVLLVTSSIVY